MDIIYLIVLFSVAAVLGWIGISSASRKRAKAPDSLDWELEQRAIREERRR